MNYRLEQLINGPAGTHPFWDAVMFNAAYLGEAIFVAVVVVWFLAGWWRGSPRDRQGAIAALLAALAGLLINLIISHIYYEPRPFVTHPLTVHLLLHHGRDASFPSDHASAGFGIATVLFIYRRRWGALLLFFAALMSYARVYVGDHYPGDVAAGLVIGVLVGMVVVRWLGPLVIWLQRSGDRLIVAWHLPFAERISPDLSST